MKPHQKRRVRDWLREPPVRPIHEPAIKDIKILCAEDGRSVQALAERAGVSPSTLRNWFSGKTMRPQLPTVKAVLKAIGYNVVIMKDSR